MSVAERFKTLLDRIEPTPEEVRTYETHRRTVTARIKKAYGEKTIVQLMGSHCRGSAIRTHSDYDLVVKLKRADVRWGNGPKSSKTALDNMAADLADRFFRTAIGRDECAVVADFADGRFSVDIVPAFFERFEFIEALDAERPILAIPDGSGGWLATCPEAHNKYIDDADAESRGKLKKVSKMLKFWTTCRSPRTPLLNFHIELVLAETRLCTGAKSYAFCVAQALCVLTERKLAGLRDPLGISNIVPAAKSTAKRAQALATVLAAAERAVKAIEAEQRGRPDEAYRLWDLVFNGHFPKR